MAVRALPRWHRMRSGQWEAGAVVIERGIKPGGRVMALLASLWEVLCDVIRIRRALKIFQMARDTSRARKVVVIADVAVGALSRWHHVSAR